MNETEIGLALINGCSDTPGMTVEHSDENVLIIFVLWGVLLPLVAVVGLVGNVLTMMVLWRREMNSTTILYMRGLVITDTGILLGSVLTLTPIACAHYFRGDVSHYFEKRVYPVIYAPGEFVVMTLQQMNVWITVSLSAERYIAICHPYRAPKVITRRNGLALMACITALSLLYNLPRLAASRPGPCEGESAWGMGETEGSNGTGYGNDFNTSDKESWKSGEKPAARFIVNRAQDAVVVMNPHTEQMPAFSGTPQPEFSSSSTSSFSSPSSSSFSSSSSPSSSSIDCVTVVTTPFGLTDSYRFYRTIMYLITIYVLPFIALLFLNSLLIRELMIMQRRNITPGCDDNEANFSLVLILVVTVFIFCQTPGLISQFDFIPISLFVPWLGVSNLLFATNSAVNFLIYTAFGRKFRRVLLRVFRHVCATSPPPRGRATSTSSSYNATVLLSVSRENNNARTEKSPVFSKRNRNVNFSSTKSKASLIQCERYALKTMAMKTPEV